jgi:Holliday junction resolvasome RuvABC endonuclease subunit
MLRIAAFDLSLVHTGFAVLEHNNIDNFWVWTTGAIKPSPALQLEERLDTIVNGLVGLSGDCDYVFVEDYVQHSHTASVSAMVHGVVRLSLWRGGVLPVLVAPKTIKKYATGRGNATKDDMRMELYKRFADDQRDDNIVDAKWLAAAASDVLGEPVVKMPQVNRDALSVINIREPRRVVR